MHGWGRKLWGGKRRLKRARRRRIIGCESAYKTTWWMSWVDIHTAHYRLVRSDSSIRSAEIIQVLLRKLLQVNLHETPNEPLPAVRTYSICSVQSVPAYPFAKNVSRTRCSENRALARHAWVIHRKTSSLRVTAPTKHTEGGMVVVAVSRVVRETNAKRPRDQLLLRSA
jgi:hypothetical protein